MNRLHICILACLMLAQTSVGIYSGIAFGLDDGVVKEVESALMPHLIDAINNMEIPDVSSGGFKVTDILLNLGPIEADNILIQMQESNNAIILTAYNFGGSISGKVDYSFISGEFSATIRPGGATILISMPMASQYYHGAQLPALAIDQFVFSLDASKIDISLSGSFTADVLNLFIQIFDDLIIGIIEGQIEKKVPGMLAETINAAIYQTHGYLDFSNPGLGFYFAYSYFPKVTNTQLDVYLEGLFYYTESGLVIPASASKMDLTLDPTSENSMQLEITKYSADSLLLAMDEAAIFDIVIDGSLLEPTLDFTLDTTHLDTFFPGLVDVYGADIPMSIALTTLTIPESIIHEDQMGALFSFSTLFNVQDAGTAFALSFHDVEVILTIYMEDFVIYPKIDRIKIDKITVDECHIEELSPNKLKILINSMISVVVPIINALLKDGITFPESIFDGKITVESAAFKAWEEYIQIQLAPHFHF